MTADELTHHERGRDEKKTLPLFISTAFPQRQKMTYLTTLTMEYATCITKIRSKAV
jgi:hypothetical protein